MSLKIFLSKVSSGYRPGSGIGRAGQTRAESRLLSAWIKIRRLISIDWTEEDSAAVLKVKEQLWEVQWDDDDAEDHFASQLR